ncbi:MAG: S8 family serine peptidase [Xanthomonadales bacterium]|nr:S8 family serine peptidase [Xanthomonadales bacterium]
MPHTRQNPARGLHGTGIRPGQAHMHANAVLPPSRSHSIPARRSQTRSLLTASLMLALSATTAGAQDATAEFAGYGQPLVAPTEVYDQFIVKFRGPASLQKSLRETSLMRTERKLGLELTEGRRTATGSSLLHLDRALSADAALRLIETLESDPSVEFVEPDRILHPALTPNDSRYAEQWHYFETTGGINLPAAWNLGTGAGVVVAVLDTGITAHPDLDANLAPGYDFISDPTVAGDGNGRDSSAADPGDFFNGRPSSWHGTHVAGTVAAVSNNGSGVAGVAFGARVQPIRVLGRGGGSLSDVADAVIWASGGSVSGVPANPTPARVINMSLGGSGGCGPTMQAAVDAAVARGSVVVVAAGNSNSDATLFVPASCANVVTVAATTRSGGRAAFSNYGASIDVSAPGENILSTLNTGSSTPLSASYASYNGTSMAAPHVAGVVALMQGLSTRTPAQVEAQLRATARALPAACPEGCGAGIVNAWAAMGGSGPPPVSAPPPPPPAPGQLEISASNTRDLSIRDNANVESSLPITGWTGAAPADTRVSVKLWHSRISQLTVQLLSPDNRVFTLHDRSGGTAANIDTTYTIDASSALASGVWRLRIVDGATGHTGYLDEWRIRFPGANSAPPPANPAPVQPPPVVVPPPPPPPPPPPRAGATTYTNTNDFTIRDNSSIDSTIAVGGRSGNAAAGTVVSVAIVHGRINQLQVSLIAPGGRAYLLHDRAGGTASNLNASYIVDLSAEAAGGVWKLRVTDMATGFTGYLDSWSIRY